jgi:NAD-dependent dihydropyrimidine dehydrogenase PreA subunit
MNTMVYLRNVVTLKLDPEKCNRCSMCMDVCPRDVFSMGTKSILIRNLDNCMECGACALNCPEEALTVRSGVGCAAGIINGILRNSEPTCDCSSGSSACC